MNTQQVLQDLVRCSTIFPRFKLLIYTFFPLHCFPLSSNMGARDTFCIIVTNIIERKYIYTTQSLQLKHWVIKQVENGYAAGQAWSVPVT